MFFLRSLTAFAFLVLATTAQAQMPLRKGPLSASVTDAMQSIHFERYEQAADTLSRASLDGDWVAEEMLASLYLDGKGRSVDVPKGLDLLNDACSHLDVFACEALGRLYDDGVVVPRDIPVAIKWYKKAGADYRIRQLQPDTRGRPQVFYLQLGVLPDIAPQTCEARVAFDRYVRAFYKRLDSKIKVPPVSSHWGGAEFEVELDQSGGVVSAKRTALYGGGPPLGMQTADALVIGWLTAASEYSSEKMDAYSDQIQSGIHSASPLPAAPAWLPSSEHVMLRYPPSEPDKLRAVPTVVACQPYVPFPL